MIRRTTNVCVQFKNNNEKDFIFCDGSIRNAGHILPELRF